MKIKNKNISRIRIASLGVAVLGAALLIFHALAFNGPSSSSGVGSGALGTDTFGDVSIGTSTTQTNTRLLILGSTTDSSAYGLQILNSAKTAIFTVRNDGTVAIPGTLSAGTLTGTITAGNVSAGTFGANTGGGNYSFPSYVGIGTTGPSAPLQVTNLSDNPIEVLNGMNSDWITQIFQRNGVSQGLIGIQNQYSPSSGMQANSLYMSTFNGSWHDVFGFSPDGTKGWFLGSVGISGGSGGAVNPSSGTALAVMNGNVGIGTASPGYALDVAGQIHSSSGGFVFPDGTVQTTASTGTGTVTAGNVSAGSFGANTGGGNYSFPGNVGIGTTGPSAKLNIVGAYSVGASIPTTWAQINAGRTGIVNGNRSFYLDIFSSPFYGAEFSTYKYDDSTTFPMIFQANGGSIVIGSVTNAPSKLAVSGNVSIGSGYIGTAAPTDGAIIAGNVGIGTTSPVAKLEVNGAAQIDGNFTVGSNKITAGTVDPLYTIDGTNYATYLPGMTGQKEETAGVLSLTKDATGSYRYTINFADEPQGSDLWLFAKAANIKNAMDQLVVTLTPSFDGRVWYNKDVAHGILTVYGDASGEVSYNLTAPRFDAAKWTNIAPVEDNGETGFIIND